MDDRDYSDSIERLARTKMRPRKAGHRAGDHRGRASRTAVKTEAATRKHPVFGSIPLVSRVVEWRDGIPHEVQEYDPLYKPPMPRGAVRGDITRQDYCALCDVPRYYYVDGPRTCVQCGVPFVFRANEQKHWYETLRFNLRVEAVRCVSCRRQRRSDKALVETLAQAKEQARKRPGDPGALLAVVEAVVGYRKRYGQGDLNEAIAAIREARKLLKDHPSRDRCEPDFWEGICHALAGRTERARQHLEKFVHAGARGRRQVTLTKEARTWLATVDATMCGARSAAEVGPAQAEPS